MSFDQVTPRGAGCVDRGERAGSPIIETPPGPSLWRGGVTSALRLFSGRDPARRASELQTALAGGIGQSLDASVEQEAASVEKALLDVGFFTEDNVGPRFAEWRELFGRAGLTPREVHLVLALARKIGNAARIVNASKKP